MVGRVGGAWSRSSFRTVGALGGLLLVSMLAAEVHGAEPSSPAAPARSALAREGYPWYDASTDRVVPILSQPDFEGGRWKAWGDWLSSWFRPVGNLFGRLNLWSIPGIGKLGDVVAIGLALLLLTVVLVVLAELLRRYRPSPEDAQSREAQTRPGAARRIEGLPVGVRLDSLDPWSEAQRRRARGDYAGAVVYLFAHQLLTLDRIRQVRLVPGRTGRQLVRTIGDGGLRATVEPTLRMFEAVYYGRLAPTAEAFEVVWAHAQTFESRAAAAGGTT